MSVPKIIHQIMFNFDTKYPIDTSTYVKRPIPEKWEESPIEWKHYHPTWRYILWDDLMARNLIKTHYSFFLDTYDNYKYPIQRTDAARYFILHHYGGIYCDLDLVPIEPIDRYLNGIGIDVYFVYGDICVANSFIASRKGAKFWELVFQKLQKVKVNCFVKYFTHFDVMTSTGPIFLKNALIEFDGTTGRLPKRFYNHEQYDHDSPILVSLEGMSWCRWDSRLFSFINNNAKLFIFLAVSFIVLLIFFLFYYLSEYRAKYNTCRSMRSR